MRFFAALAVVLVHVDMQFSKTRWMLIAQYYGYVGVTFFFLLSGFVLTWSSAYVPARRFWWLRFSRIWPATAVTTVFAFIVVAASEQIPGRFGRIADVLLLQAWWPDRNVYYGGNGVTWSLSAEMFFYLLFPLAIIPVRRLRSRGLLLLAVATLAIMAALPALARADGMPAKTYTWLFFVFPPYRFGEFLLGMVLARAVLLGLRVPVPAWTWCAGALGLGGAIWWLTTTTMAAGHVVSRPYVALLVLPPFGLMIAAGAVRDVQSRSWWLASRPLLRLGEWSFALYLVHKPVFLLTRPWGWWGVPRGLASVGSFVAYIALAVAVAAALHYAVEKPVERFLRRLPVGQHRRVGTPAPSPIRTAASIDVVMQPDATELTATASLP